MILSVICTCYNASQYLKESLDSLLNQKFNEFELILVDDGSSDNTRSILLDYKNKFQNCKVLVNKYNEGVPISRNRAILDSAGSYIAIHDADDISLPDRFQKQIEYFQKNTALDILGSYAYKISSNGELTGSLVYPPKDTFGAFFVINRYKLNPIIDSSSMFKKETFIKYGGYSMLDETKNAQDFELWCRLLCHGCKLENIQEPLIKYRINPNGITRTKHKEMRDATDLIWSRFKRKTFSDPNLNRNIFQEDSFFEI